MKLFKWVVLVSPFRKPLCILSPYVTEGEAMETHSGLVACCSTGSWQGVMLKSTPRLTGLVTIQRQQGHPSWLCSPRLPPVPLPMNTRQHGTGSARLAAGDRARLSWPRTSPAAASWRRGCFLSVLSCHNHGFGGVENLGLCVTPKFTLLEW